MATKKETAFKNRIRPMLDALPSSWWVKVQQVGIRGTPDILGCVNGCFVALELKRSEKQAADPLQEYIMNKIDAANGVAFVVTPENWHAVYRELCLLAQK